MKKNTDDDVKAIIKKNICNYFNAIFFGIALLLIIAGSYRSLTFLPVIIANTLIGIFQQLRAKKILDRLTLISEAKYTIIRDGKKGRALIDDLLKGDIIILESGQQIPADAVLLKGKITANESLLTGEADEVEKIPGSALMSGSYVVSGRCGARLEAVGADSYIAKLTAKAKEMKEKPSEMIRDINAIVKVAGIVIIPIGILLFYQGMAVNGLSFSESVVSMVAAVIGMIPEGLYLLVTAALTLSAARLAKQKVLLHDMKSTETLARVDVLCVDKTGTITNNEMSVEEVFAPEQISEEEMKKSEDMLASYIAASEDNNITSAAMREYYPYGAKINVLEATPFSSKLKYSEMKTDDGVYRFGAPDIILNGADMEKNRAAIDERAGRGERVLVFAKMKDSVFDPLLFVSLSNGFRPNVKETFAYFAEQEVKVVVISGDNPMTVSRIAISAGISGADKYVDAGTLKTREDIKKAVEKYTVFGRVKPEQKKQIVKEIKRQGLKVAMTGDGVNDILAMKEADCSIAMGAGCDAARQAAQVVLLDSDFSHMKEIIAEGRRDINNLTRSATLFLYKNIFSMLLAIFSIASTFSYPLQPSQVSLVSMFNIGIPAFALALEANIKKQHGRFIKITLMKSMPAALTSFLSIAALVVFGRVFSVDESDIGIASTFLLSMVGFMILIKLCEPMNAYRRVVLIGCIVGFVLCAYYLSSLFAISYVSYQCLMFAAVFAIVQESLMRNFTKLFERFSN